MKADFVWRRDLYGGEICMEAKSVEKLLISLDAKSTAGTLV